VERVHVSIEGFPGCPTPSLKRGGVIDVNHPLSSTDLGEVGVGLPHRTGGMVSAVRRDDCRGFYGGMGKSLA